LGIGYVKAMCCVAPVQTHAKDRRTGGKTNVAHEQGGGAGAVPHALGLRSMWLKG